MDGVYCSACDVAARKSENPLWRCYENIRLLIEEEREFYSNFKVRQKVVEAALQKELDKRVV